MDMMLKENLKVSIEKGWELLKNARPLLTHEIDKGKIEGLLESEQLKPKLKEGLACWQVAGLSESFLETCRKEAVQLYKERRFEESRDVFLFLTALNHWEPRFWIGYGLSERHRPEKNLQAAQLAFACAIGLDETNPYPYIYYAEVLMELKEMKSAGEYLEMAAKLAGDPRLRAYVQQLKTGCLYGHK